MSTTTPAADRLYALLPAVHRLRDAEAGEPLRALLAAVADQVAVLEEGTERLYDDLFVETCAPWVLPYLGDLLGIGALPSQDLGTRGEVANTIAFRRRKGTAAMLEQLARDVSGAPARAVEAFRLLATTQHLNHLRPESHAFVSLRGAARLEQLGGAFQHLPGSPDFTRTAEVRGARRGGRYNVMNVLLHLWRLRAYRLGRSPLVPAEEKETGSPPPARCFRFDPLGRDLPLFHRPQTEDEATHLAEPVNAALRIGRRMLDAAPVDFYGADRSFFLETLSGGVFSPVEATLVAADLSAWQVPSAGKVAVDPVLGRVTFGDLPQGTPVATFHYGFGADLGGGEYPRLDGGSDGAGSVLRVASLAAIPGAFATLGAALEALPEAGGVIEIADNGAYSLPLGGDQAPLRLDLGGRRVVLRAADGVRPLVRLGGTWRVTGGPEDSLVLDGLLLAEGRIEVETVPGDEPGLGRLRVAHCTLAPGAAVALDVRARGTRVEIDSAILGGVRTALDAAVRAEDAILDAGADTAVAYADETGNGFGAPLRAERCTVVGRVKADALDYVSNCILLAALPGGLDPQTWPAPVVARRRQDGCVRFSYLPLESRSPRRHRCQPARSADAARVRPRFTSVAWGDPAYMQLAAGCASEIRRGADDESEMGAFHDLFLPLREAHLTARLEESLRFGQQAGLVYES